MSRLVVFVNLGFVLLISIFGPRAFADARAVQQGRPAVFGVTGYRLGLDAQGKVAVDIGPEPAATPHAPYLAIPSIPRQSEATHPVNSPIHLELACGDSTCSLRLEPTGLRRDFTIGVKTGPEDDWQLAGAIDVVDGQLLRLREPPTGDDAGQDERLIPIHVTAEAVQFGDCTIPFDPDPRRTLVLPVLELRFTATEGGCRLIPVDQVDVFRGRWLKRSPDGSFDIPAHSLFELRGGRVRWFPLENHNLDAQLLSAEGIEVEAPAAVEVEFPVDAPVRLGVFRRRFIEISLGSGRAQECMDDWRPGEVNLLGKVSGTGCRRLIGSFRPLGFVAELEKQGPRQLLTIRLDRADVNWGHRVFLDLPYAAWEAEVRSSGEARERVVPRRHVLLTGRWPEGASLAGSAEEEVLAVPFRLYGTTPYRAVMTLERGAGSDHVTLRVADATRRGEVDSSRAALTLGPPESQAIVVYERPSSPYELARAVLWPTVLLSIAMAVLAVLARRIGPVALRAAAFTSTLATLVAYTLLQKSLVAYSVVVHAPHDWEAFDQLMVSALVLPLALALAAASALLVDERWRPRERSQYPWVFVAVMFVIAGLRLLGSLVGWESIGPLRFVVVTPLLGALVWMSAAAAARAAEDAPAEASAASIRARRMLDGSLVLAAGLMVLSWWADKGALLMLAVPVALALVFHAWRLRRGTLVIVAIALGFAAIFLVPREVIRLWSIKDRIEIPALPAASGSSCELIDDDGDERRVIEQSCRTQAAPDDDALGTIDRLGLLDTSASVATRRHPLRRLDWLEDGARVSDCDAIDRFPTRDAMEVGFFRALVDRYRSEQETVYLREQLLPFSPGITDALLNDYAGLVTYLPQMPRGTFSTVGIMLAALLLLALGHGRPWQSWAGAAAVGAAGLLAGAGVLTVAANLDVFPNFAQSIPLLALRSHSALLLDALALALIGFGLARHRAREARHDPA